METERKVAAHALEKLFSGITTSHLEPQFSKEGIKAALVQIMDLAQEMVVHISDAQEEPGVECAAGCSYCCYTQVKLTPAEALLAFSWMDQEFSNQDKILLWKRVENNRRLTEGQSLSTRVSIKKNSPCIFLKNNGCSIYPVRPFICRSWSSYSRQRCMDAFNTGDHTAEIETSTSSNFVFSLARQSIQTACHNHGLESQPLELPRAMDCCHTNTAPFTHWLGGKHLFEGI